MKTNPQTGVIDVNAIPALNNPIISKEMREEFQQEYDAMHQFLIKKHQHPTTKESIWIDHFREGFLYQYDGPKRLKYARIFVSDDDENGNIGYELFPSNIKKLDMGSWSEIEQHVLRFIYTPIPNPQYGIGCSIFHNPSFFFHTLKQQSNYYSGFAYRSKDKIEVKLDWVNLSKSWDRSDDIKAHILPEGLIVIYN